MEKGQEENERGPGSVRWLEEGIARRYGETEEKKPRGKDMINRNLKNSPCNTNEKLK